MKILFFHENVQCDLSNERKLCQEFNYAIKEENKLTIFQKFKKKISLKWPKLAKIDGKLSFFFIPSLAKRP